MRIKEMVEQNNDTMAWGGGSFLLALAGASELEIIVYPALGWLCVYVLKKIVAYSEGLVTRWMENRKTKSNLE